MIEALQQLHWTGIALADFVVFMLGYVWYVVLFPHPYAHSLGRTFDPSHKPGPLFILRPLFCNTVVIVTSALLMAMLNIHTVAGALQFGFLVGLGYLVPMTINISINPNFPRPFSYARLSGGYFLSAQLLSSLILATV